MLEVPSGDTYRLALRVARARSTAAVAAGYLPADGREDWVQEGLLAVARALPQYDRARSSLRTFVEKVVATRFASAMRVQRRRPASEPIAERHLVGLDGIPAVGLRIDVQRVIATLREGDRRLALLLTELTPTEAGRALGISRPTVYERITRIRAAFEKAGYGPHGGRAK